MKRKVSKCQFVVNDIKNKIKLGIYREGIKIKPELEMCEEYNVSRITVRNAIAILETENILYRVQGKGTFVNSNYNKTEKYIGVIMECIYSNESRLYPVYFIYGLELINQVESAVSDIGGNVVLFNSNGDVEKEKENFLDIAKKKLDGLIVIHTGYRKNYKYVEELSKTELPMVLVDRWFDSDCPISAVTTDNFDAGYKGTLALINNFGCKNILFVNSGDFNNTCTERIHGFKTACEENNVKNNVLSVLRGMNLDKQCECAVRDYLKENPNTDGIFCISPGATLGTYYALRDLKVKDVSLAYVDHLPVNFSDYNRVEIIQSLKDISRIAVYMLENYNTLDRRVVKVAPEIKIIEKR